MRFSTIGVVALGAGWFVAGWFMLSFLQEPAPRVCPEAPYPAVYQDPVWSREETKQRAQAMNNFLFLCRAYRAEYTRDGEVPTAAPFWVSPSIVKGLKGCELWSFEAGWPFQLEVKGDE